MSRKEYMMQQLNIYEAKTNFSQLIEKVGQGKSFVITESGKPLAKLVPLNLKLINGFRFGTLKGKIKIADSFNAPLSDNFFNLFETDF